MTNYLPLKRFAGTRKNHERSVRTVCRECTVGCGLVAYVKDNRIVDIQGDEDHPVSRGKLCAKGSAFIQGLTHPDRITTPASRTQFQESFETLDNWEKGLDRLAESLRKTRDLHGPDALIIGCDPEAGLDFYLGARRFARLWGTVHVYHPWEEPEANAMLVRQSPVGLGTQWINSRCLLLVEADCAVTHPMAFGWMLEAQSQGAKLIVADSHHTTTMSKADLALTIRPGSGNNFGLYLLKHLLEEGLENKAAIETVIEKNEHWKATFDRLPWDGVEEATGLSTESILSTARLLSDKHPSTVITGKQLAYVPKYRCWITLAASLGWVGCFGGGWYPLDAGLPDFHPESGVKEPSPEQLPAKMSPFPYQPQKCTNEDLSFKALIGSGNCLSDYFLPLQRQSSQMDLVVHFSAFPNESCQQAHMVFPATAWAERDGLCCNNDRGLQWAPGILPPAGSSRSGLDFWAGLAQRFSWDEFFPWIEKEGQVDQFAFYNWLLKKDPQTAGCRLSLLRDKGEIFYWPNNAQIPIVSEPPHFHTPSGRLQPVVAPELPEPAGPEIHDIEYPFLFLSTSIFTRNGTASNWWPWIAELEDVGAVRIHPETARLLGIENGDDVIVDSRQGRFEGRAWVNRTVTRRMILAPWLLPADQVLVHKKGQPRDEALQLLRQNAL